MFVRIAESYLHFQCVGPLVRGRKTRPGDHTSPRPPAAALTSGPDQFPT